MCCVSYLFIEGGVSFNWFVKLGPKLVPHGLLKLHCLLKSVQLIFWLLDLGLQILNDLIFQDDILAPLTQFFSGWGQPLLHIPNLFLNGFLYILINFIRYKFANQLLIYLECLLEVLILLTETLKLQLVISLLQIISCGCGWRCWWKYGVIIFILVANVVDHGRCLGLACCWEPHHLLQGEWLFHRWHVLCCLRRTLHKVLLLWRPR